MKFKKLLQVGIVTANVEESVKQFQAFGFEPWTVLPFEPHMIPGMTMNGEPGDLRFKGAMYRDENLEIELIEPVSEGLFMDWLKEHGPGVHHLAFKPEPAYDDFVKEYHEKGYKTALEVCDGEGTPCFSYLDTLAQLGFYTEIHHGAPGNPDDFIDK